jgi:Ca2+-binding EF-hand superfamily protein
MFIASQLMSREEKNKLTSIFMAPDENDDGTITKDKLLKGYTKLYDNYEKAVAEVETLML